MGVVERAGGPLHQLAAGGQKPVANNNEPPAEKSSATATRRFELNYEALSNEGLFHPDIGTTQLALELRAVKRRLLRRCGYLRSGGERQEFRTPGRQRNVILITSTSASEGKTFCAINIALSLAIEDQIDTLLIDADAPRPKVRRRLGVPAGPGLTDRLSDPALDVNGLVYRAAQAPLGVLGEGKRVNRPTELFASEDSKRLWTELSMARPEGLVIIDAPPVLATTEAVALAKFADEIVFVIEANATTEPAVAAALDELLDINPNVNLLLNRCLIGSGGAHYGSYHYYERSADSDED
ncbi:MAG: P-loop NTPase family protein [Hyphococcus sp.]